MGLQIWRHLACLLCQTYMKSKPRLSHLGETSSSVAAETRSKYVGQQMAFSDGCSMSVLPTSIYAAQSWTSPVHTHMLPGPDLVKTRITTIHAICSFCMGQLRTHQMHLHRELAL